MSDVFDETWASDDDALITTPSAAEIRQGFRCGPADPGVFNYLFQSIMTAINQFDVSNVVSRLRSIQTTEGVKGGGNLEADRTLRLAFEGLEEADEIAPDDYLAIYDTSVSAHRKVSREDFIAGLGGDGGTLTGGANIGTGEGEVYSGVSGSTLQFRKIKAGNGVSVAVSTNDVVISLANRGSELTFS